MIYYICEIFWNNFFWYLRGIIVEASKQYNWEGERAASVDDLYEMKS